jgi:DNA-binding CsgD family transcriptional regulator/PAS domain-containing protein
MLVGDKMAAPKFDELLGIAFNFNDAVLSQNTWQTALQDLADAFGGSFATFEVIDKKTRTHVQHHDSSELEVQTEYLKHFMPINPRYAFGFRPDAPNIMHDAQFMSEQDMNRNEFYMDFLRPHDLRYFLAYKAYETHTHIGVFTIQKSKKSKPPSEEDLQAFNQLAPSFSRVADSQFEYGHLFASMRNLENVIDGMEDGVLVLDANGTVGQMNSAADRIVRLNDGISISSGKIVCGDAEKNEKLAQLIHLLSNNASLAVSEKILLIQRNSNSHPYQIRIQRSTGCQHDQLAPSGALIMFIRDPDQVVELDVLALIDSFGLTPAEASIAILITKGQAANEISISLKVSVPTVRSHIQRIMQKMGVTRQIDVVRILTRYL